MDTDANTAGASTGGQDSGSLGPPTSGYATVMLDVASFEVLDDGEYARDKNKAFFNGAGWMNRSAE